MAYYGKGHDISQEDFAIEHGNRVFFYFVFFRWMGGLTFAYGGLQILEDLSLYIKYWMVWIVAVLIFFSHE